MCCILLLLPAPPRCCRSQGSAHSHKSVSGSGKVRYWLLPILAPLTLLKHYLAEYPDRYLQAQNYFDPYPQDLALRLTVN